MPYYILLLSFVLSTSLFAQNHSISGTVTDASSNEALINATILVVGTSKGCVSNNYGFYSLQLAQGEYEIMVSYVGYKAQVFSVKLNSNYKQTIALEALNALNEVEIKASKRVDLSSTRMSTLAINLEQTHKTPTIMGEPDMFKIMQLTPGIEAGTEGGSGLYVRGGDNGQNLILIDGIPVYNVSHMMGFISVFNPEAVRKSEIIKGGFPARYGGRTASVLDVRMKEGNTQKLKGAINISTLMAGGSIEGPLGDKTGFMLAARRTIFDPIYAGFNSANSSNEGIYSCWDINAKVNHRFNDKHRVYASFFTGYDHFRNDEAVTTYTSLVEQNRNNIAFVDTINVARKERQRHKWGNVLGALRWNYIWNTKLFSNTSLTYTKFYNYQLDERKFVRTSLSTGKETTEGYVMQSASDIEDYAMAMDFDWFANPAHHVRFGYQLISHQFRPTLQLDTEESGTSELKGQQINPAFEGAFYIEDDIQLTEKLRMNAGLRFAAMTIDDTVFPSFEPRLSLTFSGGENWSLKASYMRTKQFIHLVSPSSVGYSTDYWVPASKALPPELADQWALGTVVELPGNLMLTIEGYYKQMQNVIEFRDNKVFTMEDQHWESYLLKGKGWSYGVESMIQKIEGKFTGWIAYTWARSWRKLPELNLGETYPYKFDRPHNLTFVGMYTFNKNWDVGVNWMLASGYNFSFAKEKIAIDLQYFGKNNMRYPMYHRLDVGANWHKQKKHGKRTWRMGAYNAYNQMNPSYYTITPADTYIFMGETVGDPVKIIQTSLFPIIPYVSFRFAFGE